MTIIWEKSCSLGLPYVLYLIFGYLRAGVYFIIKIRLEEADMPDVDVDNSKNITLS